MQPVLTVLANLHREGHLAYPALSSAVLAVEHAARRGIGCRIVAVIDRGDDLTREQLDRFRPRLDAVYEVDYGDVAGARNHGIGRIDTKYVATLDGDDLFDADWLWKGVQFLEQLGDDRAVGHTEARLSFGAELHGRLHISSDSPLFNPLNLISSWHWATDAIVPTNLYRNHPFVPNDHENGLGAEDWLWTCESIVDGIRHVVIPGTTYFYRRHADHVSLGMVPGIAFRPTRLFEKSTIEALNRAWPSAALRFGGRVGAVTGASERWAHAPHWLEESVRRACDLDLEIYDLHRGLGSVPFETPDFFPAVGRLYLTLMARIEEGRETVAFFCNRLEPRNLGLIDRFLAVHRRRRSPALNVLVVSLAGDGDEPPPAALHEVEEGAANPDTPWLHLRHVDLGRDVAFARLWERPRLDLIVRFLLQARPALAVNLDSGIFDGLMADFGKALRACGTRTVRICHAHGDGNGDGEMIASWRSLMRAEGNYSVALCPSARVAASLEECFRGTGFVARLCATGPEACTSPDFGGALHALLTEAESSPQETAGIRATGRSPAMSAIPDGAGSAAREPDVTCALTVRSEGFRLNQTFQTTLAMCADAGRQGLATEIVIVADRAGARTRSVLSSLARKWPAARVIETALDDEAGARNAGIAAAKGRTVAILTGADVISPGWLAGAVRRVREHGPDAIAHPHAVVELNDGLVLGYQPDMDDPETDLGILAFQETWTVHALAETDLFRRIPYASAPASSGYGHAAWHWNCETVVAGCRHLTVPQSAVYLSPAGFAGQRTATLGARAALTLPPTRFFSDHAWLRQRNAATKGRSRAVPTGWDDGVYQNAQPDVQGAVAAGEYPSGYAHYCIHGRAEGRAATWMARPARELASPPPSALARLFALPAWLQKKRRFCKSVLDAPRYRRLAVKARLERDAEGPVPRLSQWLDEEMGSLSTTDPAFLHRCSDGLTRRPRATLLAADLYRSCRETVAAVRPTHILVAASLRPGGAELSMLHCIEAILSSPENRVLVLTTASGDDRWRHRLPAPCARLPFADLAADRPNEEKIEVLTRLLVNSGARCLHLFYSQLGWDVLARHAAALADRMRVFVSIFSVPPVEAGVGSGYAREVARLRPHLAGIFTDNRRAAETLRTTCGVPRDRVVVVQHPVAAEHRFSGPTTGNDLVLWAGRLDHHKRPDLLGEIAKRLPARTIHVYGVNVLDDGRHLERLRRAPNVSYRGPFCGFDTIETAPYGCFVYTSSWDGLPNVLLEAMKSGLQVVAPDVGGIAEVVDDDSGLLVRNTDEPGAYAEAIERAFRDPETYRRVAENGRRRVAETHTRAAFLETLKTAPGYL